MTVFYIVVLAVSIWLLIKRRKSVRQADTQNCYDSVSYPYRSDVEFRLPNGRITTKGYAARYPAQFTHWIHGPENVYGENIDRNDWEDWRINYYGK